jgi:hypothetical protein
MFIPEAAHKNIILYTQTELYMITFGSEVNLAPLGLNKFLQTTPMEKIVEAISSVFTGSDILLYLITTKGNLMFVTVSPTTNKIVTVEPIFLGEF